MTTATKTTAVDPLAEARQTLAGAKSRLTEAHLEFEAVQREFGASPQALLERRLIQADLRSDAAAVDVRAAAAAEMRARADAAATLLDQIEAEYHAAATTALDSRTSADVEKAVNLSGAWHRLFTLCREKLNSGGTDQRFFWARAMRINPRQKLEPIRKLSPMLQPGPGRQMPVVDESRWAHLHLEELPTVE